MKRFGHETMNDEKSTEVISQMSGVVNINLEGVDIVRGTHPIYGFVTLVCPVAGNTILLYPFESQQ